MNIILKTPRLVVREFVPGDVEFVATMLCDPEVMRFWPRCLTRDESEAWIRRQRERYEQYGYGYWLALDKLDGAPVGQIGLVPVKVDGRDETALGYMLHRPFWQRGLATEGAAGALALAFDVLGKQRVVAPIRPANIRSLCVAWRLRMQPERLTMFSDFDHLILVATRTGFEADAQRDR